ncbi:signal peptidase I [[Clostridium] innocuum]|uniref:signal peptidase I n=2 Tax=Clostridium innocuum TaxID=1522 RepID=UPI001F1D9C32|nr:signal peptidase I [[Clostridium] innocuum]
MKKYKLMSIAGTICVVLVILAAFPFTLPRIFGIEIYGILTGSMDPACPTGSLVYVKSDNPESLQEKDIVTFQKGNLVITHRVVKNDVQKEELITKGDANNANDIQPVAYEQIKGKVALTVPLLGYLALRLNSAAGISVCVIILALGLMLWVLGDMMSIKKKSLS